MNDGTQAELFGAVGSPKQPPVPSAPQSEQSRPAYVVKLPRGLLPPSTNHLYKTIHIPPPSLQRFLDTASELASGRRSWRSVVAWMRGRRKPSKELMAFKADAALFFAAAMPEISVPVEIEVQIWGGKGWVRSADVSNRIKAVEDLLVVAGRIADDDCRHVRSVSCRYIGRAEHCALVGWEPTKKNQGQLEARCVVIVTEVASA